jgi:hypothetical protein
MDSMKPLSPEEVADFMQRLNTESTKVAAVLFDTKAGFSVVLSGVLDITEGEVVLVHEGEELSLTEGALLRTSLAALRGATCEFADPLTFKGTPFASLFNRELRFSFGLVFAFPQGLVLALLEVEESEAG